MQAEKETEQLMKRLDKLGLLAKDADPTEVLTLSLEQVLNSRLQTVVHHMGLANTPKQARQFIVHGHVNIGDRTITIPGYLVRRYEESTVSVNPNSPYTSEAHPMRTQGQPKEDMTGLGNDAPAVSPPAEEPKTEEPPKEA